jgi:HK97 family phage major capsid protein
MAHHMSVPARLERKDDTGAAPADPTTKDGVRSLMTAFEAFKEKNDRRLDEIARKAAEDPITVDEVKRINDRLDQFEGVNQKLTLAEKSAKAVDELKEQFDALDTAIRRGTGREQSLDQKRAACNDWVRAVVGAVQYGVPNLPEAQRKALESVVAEYKALNVGTNTEGGYLAPVEMIREIIKAETEMSPVRSLARVRQTGMRAIEVPKRTGQFAAQWVSEQGTRAETTGLTYGVEEITTHELFALVDITNQMLEDGMFDMAAEVQMESVEQFAVAEGTAFVTGNGIGKPEGFLSNASVLTTKSGTAATIADADGQANGLITLKHAIKSAYTSNATWVMNRTTIGAVRKLKDGDKNYIWQPGLAQGRPNTIDGDPYVEMTDMPNEGAGLKPIAYGDFRRAYTWVDRIQMEMLRDPYTQATGGKIRFIMRKRVGGKLVLAEAIRVLICST